ncbi:hypothetical protein ACEV8A_14120 [Vibrio parahaemolyticus]|uniref:Molecular chaperone n=1 Tax=Vibrio owensii TaxID=696485 RepID=A0AAP9GJ26_9VIBR|nr:MULTISPECIES: hypothetical protein [Vibrio harveyi group]MBE3817040.1 hypothetical protein [Vibrio parahaemolyticus]MCR9723109.1 hypothetical protein [Vibrio parahaemolyticus]MCR9741382.1 hypothetical protein [Vibrio parahaemolyticus]MDG2642533.1 hypothetical protein [Vibrio parahaemolyticus]MDG2996587.1 hypothetical protein [Vibrio parahaemolyticus]
MKMKLKLMTAMSALLASVSTQAMSINDLMLVNSEALEGKAGIFTLSNTDDITYFLKTSVSKVEVRNNQIIKTPYTRDNLQQWDIALKPSKLVVEPRMIKELMVEEICGSRCGDDRDRVYQINIEPVAYELENEKQSKVNMMFGFAPYYVIPAKTSRVEYQLDYDGKNLRVNNTGNTIINLIIDQCQGKTTEELKALQEDKYKRCRITYSVIAGRDRQLLLPPELRQSNIDVVILNHDGTVREEHTVRSR